MRFPLPTGSKVWAYTRVSPGDDQDVGDQNREVERRCLENGYTLERLFCDEARSGSSVAGRDQFQAMMSLARSLPADLLPDGLILWSFSRLAREFDDAQYYKADLRRRGIVIMSIADDIPAEGPHARLIEAVVDWKNAQYLEDLRLNVTRGLHDIARQGYAPGGFPPRGYKAEKVVLGTKNSGEPHIVSRWVVDPEKAPSIRQAWEMRAQGASYKDIHEATRVFGSKNSYACMFRNKTYLGVRKCGELEIEDAHEALVTPELWEAVQETLHAQPKKGEPWPEGKKHSRRVRSPFLLSGVAHCIYCGAAMCGSHANVKNRPQPWPFYLCGRKKRQGWHSCEGLSIKARPAEEEVLQAVLDRVLTPVFVEELIETTNTYLVQDLAGLDQRVEETRKRLVEAERAISNLLDLAEQFGARSAADRIVSREQEKEQLQRELHSLTARREQSRIEVSPEVIRAVLADMRDELTGEDIEARRVLLKKFVAKVEMGNEEGRLWYTFPLQELGLTSLWMVPPKGFEPLSQA